METCSTSLAIWKTQIKTTMRQHITAIYDDYNPKDKHCQVLVRMWRTRLAGRNVNGKQLSQKSDGQVLKKLNIWPSNSTLRLTAKRSEHIWIHSNLYANVYSSIFTTVKGQKQPTSSTTDEKVKCSIICIEYYSAVKSFKDAKTG